MDDRDEDPDATEAGRSGDGWVPQADLPRKIQALLTSRWSWRRHRGMRLSSRWITEHRVPPREG